MKILKKLAAAAALAMAISTLTACGDDGSAQFIQGTSKPSGGALTEFNEQIFRSKVTSADSYAKEIITSVNSWIADDVCMGGGEKRACELGIVMNNGNATITDASGKNNWEGKKGNPEGKYGSPESLKERFEADYSGRTFTARVFVHESGYAVYSWFVRDDAGFNGVAPTRADFEAGEYEWEAEDRVGMTRGGAIMGTSPHLFYPKSLQKPSEPFSKPSGWTNAPGLGDQEARSKVTSADSYAKEIITSVNSWNADDIVSGGYEKYACELRIVMDSGKAIVTDLSGKNSWEGRKGNPGKNLGSYDTLEERFEADYSSRTFTACVIIDESGYAVYSWFVPDDARYNGASPSEDDFRSGHYNWGFGIDGLTSEKVIIGTYPKLAGGADER